MSLLTDEEIDACLSNPSMHIQARIIYRDFARAIEAAILAKLASAELPDIEMTNLWDHMLAWHQAEPGACEVHADKATAIINDQLRKAYAQGAAAQLAEKPSGYLSQYNLEMLQQGYPQTIVMLEGAKRDVPLYTRKESNHG